MVSTMRNFQICVDQSAIPTMYGVTCASGEKADRLSTDYTEVERLVRIWNRNALSVVHFWEAIEDFRHS